MNHSSQPEAQMNNVPYKTPNPTKMKPLFKHEMTWRCMKPSDIAYLSKSKPKMLHHISINSLCSQKIGPNGIRKLRKALTDSKNLSFLSFHNPNINPKQLTFLLDSTNHWRDLSFKSWEPPERSSQESIKTLSRLGRSKQLSNFPFSSLLGQQHVDRKLSACLYQQFKGLFKLEKLELELPLLYHIASLPQSLISLDLDFKSKDLFPQQELSSFVTSLQQRCHLLGELVLSFYEEYLLDSSDAQIWSSFFQKAPKTLKNLSLTLNISADQQPEGIQAFIGFLKHLEHIVSLNISSYCPLCFQPLPFLDDFFLTIFTSLQSLTQLEELELGFFDFFNFEENALQQFCLLLQCLKNLKKLDTSFPPLPSPDQDLIPIAESLEDLNHLRTLDLTLRNDFSHKSMQTLSNNIAHLHLINLNLDFGRLYFPVMKTIKQGIPSSESNNLIPFFPDIRNFTELSTLKLQLSHFEISNKEFKYLALALQNFKSLSSLNLTLCQFDSAKNFKGFQRLFSCLKDLPKLAYLDLSFEGERISDQQIEILSSSLAGCKSLLTLDLRFIKAAQFKDKNLYSLLPGIQSLLKLKSLVLLFQKEEAFEKKDLAAFLQGLTVLKDLTKFFFIQKVMSIYQSKKTPLPPYLQGYEKLRHLESFIVMNSRYI